MTVNAIEENTKQSREEEVRAYRAQSDAVSRLGTLTGIMYQHVAIIPRIKRKRKIRPSVKACQIGETMREIGVLLWAIEQAQREAEALGWKEPKPYHMITSLGLEGRDLAETLEIIEKAKAREETS